MADIFISYSSSDREEAKALAEAIQQQGWSVWWDRKIPFGKSFDQVIEQELDTARCVVVVWTKTSVASDWVKTEAAEGARRHVLLPVFIGDVKIPLEFRRLQAANLTNWQPNSPDSEFDRLLTHIGEMLGLPTMAGPGGADADGPRPIRNSADLALERSQKTAQEETKRTAGTPIAKPHALAERESEFKQRAPEISQQREGHSATHAVKGIGLPISRNALLILGGGVTLLILVVAIAFRPSGYTPGERPQGEPVSAPVARHQTAPEVASTIPPKGMTGRLVDQVSKITIGTALGRIKTVNSGPRANGASRLNPQYRIDVVWNERTTQPLRDQYRLTNLCGQRPELCSSLSEECEDFELYCEIYKHYCDAVPAQPDVLERKIRALDEEPEDFCEENLDICANDAQACRTALNTAHAPVPNGVFAFRPSRELNEKFDDRDAWSEEAGVAVSAEVHKRPSGVYAIAGFANDDAAKALVDTDRVSPITVMIYTSPYRDAVNAVSVPLPRVQSFVQGIMDSLDEPDAVELEVW